MAVLASVLVTSITRFSPTDCCTIRNGLPPAISQELLFPGGGFISSHLVSTMAGLSPSRSCLTPPLDVDSLSSRTGVFPLGPNQIWRILPASRHDWDLQKPFARNLRSPRVSRISPMFARRNYSAFPWRTTIDGEIFPQGRRRSDTKLFGHGRTNCLVSGCTDWSPVECRHILKVVYDGSSPFYIVKNLL